MKKFNISDVISYGWETAKAHLPFFVVVILIMGVISFGPNFLVQNTRQSLPLLSGLISLALWVVSLLVSLGTIKIVLKIIDNKKPEIADLFNGYPQLLNFVLASLLYGIIVFVGCIFFIVPGIILGIKYHFYSYLIVDKNMSPLDALRKSGDITKGSKWQLFLFGLACGLINLVGLLAFGVGLFITIPLTMLAYAKVYRILLGAPAAKK